MSDDLHLNIVPPSAGHQASADPYGERGRIPSRYSAEMDPEQGPGRHLRDYLRVLYKRRWMALSVFLTVIVGVTVYTFTVTPTFDARTRLLLESDPNVVSFEDVIDDGQEQPDYYTTQHNILESRALAYNTIETLQMWEHPLLAPRPGWWQTAMGWIPSLGDAVSGAEARPAMTPPTAAVALDEEPAETPAQSAVIDRFLAGVSVSPIRNSRLVDVTFSAPDAALATRVVNAIARTYVRQNREYRLGASRDANTWLTARLDEQRGEVEQAEAALQQYRENNDALALEDSQNIVVQRLADLNAEVTRARTERLRQESLYQQLQGLEATPDALDGFPAVLNNALIQRHKAELASLNQRKTQLSEKLGERHPEMVAVTQAIDLAEGGLTTEIQKVIQSIKAQYDAARSHERTLVSALEEQKAEAQTLNAKGVDYRVLERNAESARQVYDSLLQRTRETGVAGELQTSNIRIVDPAAQPRAPARPRKALTLALGLAVALFGAVGLVFFFEYFDNRVKSPEELQAHLGIPSLAMLPTVATSARHGRNPIMTGPVPPGFAEALKVLRTNLLFARADPGMRSVMVTSTGVGEGKSVVSANLAIVLAQAGQRVLLVDADLRRPSVHGLFEREQEPGLSNLLVGTATSEECVRETGVTGLSVLTAGRIPPNPAELLGSRRFQGLLESAKERFDWVILDTPPVLPVTDAPLVSHLASGVLFVVHAEKTSRHPANQALAQLERANARIIGGVLNRIDLDRNPYYYSAYYSREYTRYYVSA